eukprot:CAMPEP_0173393454 /NCGR_PEP_ID=MMETSP1356-20130122/22118_1 /TAXON_ID=77927 ORGANISM="Hemiselmis virescens, Strain PCC157" /NCGR_SAMPLE_ID=MMETSP1356 /ASSEMBLY_ACC=CAM_ASM_000847 /LENGTH=156 /DNA_ID=CAMNT_0014351473 /DNA_START=516 /DNA_END=983 /DNA_ORIENTATION=-
MIVVMSPAKTLDMSKPPASFGPPTQPHFTKEAAELSGVCSKLSVKDLKQLAGTSDAIAQLNKERFKDFDGQESKHAALAFDGPAYKGLNAVTFNKRQAAFAQVHLRILCGLYGVLRPFDEIKPFRLEMGSRLPTSAGSNLYQYWGDSITTHLQEGT